MGRIAVALFAIAAAREAGATPALSLSLDGSDGEVWASRAGWVRDDAALSLRLGIGVRDFVAIDVAIAEDVERFEPSLGVGARVRPWAGPCWAARWSPYLRGQISVAAASHLGSNYDLLAGAGHWGRLTSRAPWLHWFAELDVVARVGEYDSLSIRLDAGLAVATSTFWR
jgi:hypothetical protein